jgi:nitrite reductase (NADH) small subunit
MSMVHWIDIGSLEEIPRRGARVVRTPRGDIAVFRTAENRVFALRDSCPHKAGPLSQGIVHGNRVTCPLHGWVIELERGQSVPPDVGCAVTYRVEVRDGRVRLDPEPRGAGLTPGEVA